jgi:hypothetical protein
LRPTRERAHDTDVLAPETKFARAPDGVHIAYQLLGADATLTSVLALIHPGLNLTQRLRWSDPMWWARQGLNL